MRNETSTIDLWSFSLDCDDDLTSRAEMLLSSDERDRACRFRFDLHRRRFIVRHAMRRVLLAGIVGAAPSDIQFAESTRGKPRLRGIGRDIEFNSSHSNDRAVIATGRCRIGVDIEQLSRRLDYLRFARRCFTEDEYEDIRGHSREERRFAFFNCWTGKEAYIKALGAGLTRRLTGFSVRCALDKPPGLRWDEEHGEAAGDYRFHRYTQGTHVATVVAGPVGGPIRIALHELSLRSLCRLEPVPQRPKSRWRTA